MDYIELGKRIKEEREKLGLSQSQLAEKSDLSHSFIGYIERAKKIPSLKTILKIAESLQVPISLLLGETIDEIQDVTISKLNSFLKEMDIKDLNFILESVIYFKDRITK